MKRCAIEVRNKTKLPTVVCGRRVSVFEKQSVEEPE